MFCILEIPFFERLVGAHILIPDGCYSYPDGPDRLMTSAIVDPCLTRCLVMTGNSYDFFVGCVFFIMKAWFVNISGCSLPTKILVSRSF